MIFRVQSVTPCCASLDADNIILTECDEAIAAGYKVITLDDAGNEVYFFLTSDRAWCVTCHSILGTDVIGFPVECDRTGWQAVIEEAAILWLSPSFYYEGSPFDWIQDTEIDAATPITSRGMIIRFEVFSGALPSGVTLDPNTGTISGTPTEMGSGGAVIRGYTSSDDFADAEISFTILQAPEIAYAGSPFTFTATIDAGSNAPTSTGGAIDSYAISPALPAGLSFDTTTGIISGTPTAETATTSFTVTATGPGGEGQTTISITVIVLNPPVISYDDSPFLWFVGVAVSALPTNTGGTITSYSLFSGSLPAGLALNTVTGEISGMPTTVTATTTATIRATGPDGTDDTVIDFEVWDITESNLYAYYDGTDPDTLWQDSGSTVPVTAAGDPWRVIEDISGNALHLLAPNDAQRPTWLGADAGVGFPWKTHGGTSNCNAKKSTGVAGLHRNDFTFVYVGQSSGYPYTAYFDLGSASSFALQPRHHATNLMNIGYFNGAAFFNSTKRHTCRNQVVVGRSSTTNFKLDVNGSEATLAALTDIEFDAITVGQFFGGAQVPTNFRKFVLINGAVADDEKEKIVAWARAHAGDLGGPDLTIFRGDSNMCGVGDTDGLGPADRVTERLDDEKRSYAVDGDFAFAPSMSVATLIAQFGSGENRVLWDLGLNDLNLGFQTGAQLYTIVNNARIAVQAAGGKFYVATMQEIPNNDSERQAYNALLIANEANFDGPLARVDIDLPDHTDTAVITSDLVHRQKAGNLLVAGRYDEALA
jgi:hypothetical protein